mgnify:CR=1 FL=1
MVIMEFNNQYKVTGATIYDKTHNTAEASTMSDYNSILRKTNDWIFAWKSWADGSRICHGIRFHLS